MRVHLFSDPLLIFHRASQIHHTRTEMRKLLQGNESRLKDPGGSWNGRRTLSCCSVSFLLQRQVVAVLIRLYSSGVFLANSDSAIILALFRQIASEFDRLSSASWIINGYQLGLIVAQPLVCSSTGSVDSQQNLRVFCSHSIQYGKLSNIYGRKPLLLIAYGFYCVGGLLR